MTQSREVTIWCDGQNCQRWVQAGGTAGQLRRDLKEELVAAHERPAREGLEVVR